MIGTGEETDLSVSAIFKSRKDPWILDFPDYSSWKTKEDTYTDTYIPKLGGWCNSRHREHGCKVFQMARGEKGEKVRVHCSRYNRDLRYIF